jgi:hypothetical protein
MVNPLINILASIAPQSGVGATGTAGGLLNGVAASPEAGLVGGAPLSQNGLFQTLLTQVQQGEGEVSLSEQAQELLLNVTRSAQPNDPTNPNPNPTLFAEQGATQDLLEGLESQINGGQLNDLTDEEAAANTALVADLIKNSVAETALNNVSNSNKLNANNTASTVAEDLTEDTLNGLFAAPKKTAEQANVGITTAQTLSTIGGNAANGLQQGGTPQAGDAANNAQTAIQNAQAGKEHAQQVPQGSINPADKIFSAQGSDVDSIKKNELFSASKKLISEASSTATQEKSSSSQLAQAFKAYQDGQEVKDQLAHRQALKQNDGVPTNFLKAETSQQVSELNGAYNSAATSAGKPGDTLSAAAVVVRNPVPNSLSHHPTAADQISLHIANATKKGESRIQIQLSPASLGNVEVSMELKHTDNKAVINVVVDRAETFETLKADSRNLERALNDAGIKTDSGSLNFNLRGDGGQLAKGNDQQSSQHGKQFANTPFGDSKNIEHESAAQHYYSSQALDISV